MQIKQLIDNIQSADYMFITLYIKNYSKKISKKFGIYQKSVLHLQCYSIVVH